jgi:hypothetical protein
MSPFETIKAAYAAFGRNDPSVLFGAMDPAITWNEAAGNPLADGNPYVGPQAVGEGVFARLLAAIDNFTAVPLRLSMVGSTSWCSETMAARSRPAARRSMLSTVMCIASATARR